MHAHVNRYCFSRVEVRPDERRLMVDGQAVAVGGRAFDLLLALIEHRDKVRTQQELSDQVWPGLIVEENNLRQQISKLRRVLGQHAIATVPGRGYRLALELEAPERRRAEDSQPVVAVLPFANLSGDPQQEYFSDAVTEDIINGLSKYRWLTVVARNTTFGYKKHSMDVRQLGRELGAHYVVEGSVLRNANQVRVTAELVDAQSGNTLWSERYDRELTNVFEVQDEIVLTLVARLEPEIGFAERRKVDRLPPTNLHAWECYHRGLSHFFRFTAADNREAERVLQRSRELDPSFGQAHAWWAYAVLLQMVYWDAAPSQSGLDAALAAAQRALELDDHNAVFYAIKARIQVARREYGNAMLENRTAIILNPTLASAYCGMGDTLAYQGQYEQAMPCFERALALSPRDPQRWAFLTYGALALIFKQDFDLALQWTDDARESPNCQYWTLAHRAVALAYLGRANEAHEAVEQVIAALPGFSLAMVRQKLFYLRLPQQLQTYVDGLVMAGAPA
jgi:adenylate cyclase